MGQILKWAENLEFSDTMQNTVIASCKRPAIPCLFPLYNTWLSKEDNWFKLS